MCGRYFFNKCYPSTLISKMELGNKPVSCPVCTLYMREGVTLESHLDTHPKERVIEALVRLTAQTESEAQDTRSSYFRNLGVLPAVSRSDTTQCNSSCGTNFLSPGRSNLSAVLNYQHLLGNGSGNGNSFLPQYVPVSTLLNGPERLCSSPVVYNPFLLQQEQLQVISAKKSSSATHNLLNQYVPSASKPFSHVSHSVASSTPFHVTSYAHFPSTITPSMSQARLPASTNAISRASPLPSVPYSSFMHTYPDSFPQSPILASSRRLQKHHKIIQDNCDASCINVQATNVSGRNSGSRNHTLEVGERVQVLELCNKNSRLRNNSMEIDEGTHNSEQAQESRARINSTESTESIRMSAHVFSDESRTCSSPHEKLNDSLAETEEIDILNCSDKSQLTPIRCSEFMDKNKMCCVDETSIDMSEVDLNVKDQAEITKEIIVSQVGAEGNQEMVCDNLREVSHENGMESSDSVQSVCDVVTVVQPSSPGSLLRVRNDLSCSIRDSPVPSPKNPNNSELGTEQSNKEDESQNQNHSELPELMSVASSSGCIIQVFSEEKDEYITSDNIPRGRDNFLLSDKQSSESNDVFTKSVDTIKVPLKSVISIKNTSENMKLVTFDGIHIVVQPELISSPGLAGDGTDSGDDCRVITELTAVPPEELRAEPDVVTMDIQTDEMMPPKGELSEQESIGGNDISLWAPVSRADDVCTSYDLLARESWEASDGSDGEGNGIFSPIVPEKLKFSKSNCGVKGSKSSSSRAARKHKTEVARTYLCITCDMVFNCPKERRVHQRMLHHGEGNSRTRSAPKKTCAKRQPGKRKLKSLKCEKKDLEEKNSAVDSDFTKFEEVFIVKTETRDEGVAGEDNKENTCDIEKQSEKENSEGKSCANSKRKTSRRLYSCTFCEATFTRLKMLKAHTRNSHFGGDVIRLACKTCNKSFPSETLMQAHFKIHPLECTRCGKYFFRRQSLKLHIRRHLSIRPFKCEICDKSFITRQKMEEHNNTHTGNSPLKCNLCDDKFRRYSNLAEHIKRRHLKLKKKVRDFLCHCGETFHSKKKLEWHKETHSTKPKSCSSCSEKYVHEMSLTRHIRKAHNSTYVSKLSPKDQQKPCSICGHIMLRSSLQTHMRIHTGVKPFPCPVCGKQFTTKWNLNLHRWTHASRSSKPFKCSLCKSAFFRETEFKSHMHAHRNVRPYTCNYCGCQFIRKYNCQRHVREHERTKAFSCNICGKQFHRSYYLTEHLRVHSGSRPFVCHICGKASSTKSNHNKHVRIHHAREPVNTEG